MNILGLISQLIGIKTLRLTECLLLVLFYLYITMWSGGIMCEIAHCENIVVVELMFCTKDII